MLRQKVRQIGAHLVVQQRLVHLRRHAPRAELTDLLVVIGMLRAHRGFPRLHGLLTLEFLGLGRLLVLLADEFGFELRFVPLAGGAEPVFLAGVVFGARLRLLVQGHRLGHLPARLSTVQALQLALQVRHLLAHRLGFALGLFPLARQRIKALLHPAWHLPAVWVTVLRVGHRCCGWDSRGLHLRRGGRSRYGRRRG